MNFDIKKFKKKKYDTRYSRRILELKHAGTNTDCIESAVEKSVENIFVKNGKSFVIYGEPQSGKTEMMIALTARLLDEGIKTIIILLNDSVQLLNQNLERFQRSGLDPAPKNFTEILDPSIVIGENEWVIFSKKNSKDLQKLISKIGTNKKRVIIDDEADYATPNSKINKGEQTKINELVGKLLGNDGIYIGVTATPARLDLNNTFDNENDNWVDFPPHLEYTGQDLFFPTSLNEMLSLKYTLTLLPNSDDNPKYLRDALAKFFINTAYLNLKINSVEENYCMLVHTSGKKADHTEDYQQTVKVLNILKNQSDPKYENLVKLIWEIAKEKYPNIEDEITGYILNNIARNNIVVINSDVDKKVVDFASATKPSTLFTIAIGGNIISRGVTFDNLISMFFTRDSKHKIQQDTYIQRARMFGSRGKYLQFFELSIPENLYLDWQRCFVFHRLSLSAIKAGGGPPVWLEDQRINSVARASINTTNVDMENGQMYYEKFTFNNKVNHIINDNELSSIEKLEAIQRLIGNEKLPDYLIRFIKSFSLSGDRSLGIHPVRNVSDDSAYHDTLERTEGGVFGGQATDKFPEANHHIMILKNTNNIARVVYKYTGTIKTLRRQKPEGAKYYD